MSVFCLKFFSKRIWQNPLNQTLLPHVEDKFPRKFMGLSLAQRKRKALFQVGILFLLFFPPQKKIKILSVL